MGTSEHMGMRNNGEADSAGMVAGGSPCVAASGFLLCASSLIHEA